jgi:predicted N-acetyltransferase YhbS
MLTKLHTKNDEREYESLALVPVSVLPQYQDKDIGSALIIERLLLGGILCLNHL